MRKLILAAALAVAPLACWAQTEPADKLADRYTDLAGSEKNAKSLVAGLRDSRKVTLTRGRTTTTFDPPTDKMGYGNVNLALGMAEKSLADQGITDPTTEQLKTALMGGTIRTRTGTVKLEGVLQMRADGMGWGQIAHKMDFKVGEVMGKPERVSHARADRPEKPERPNKVDRPERPERPAKPERHGK